MMTITLSDKIVIVPAEVVDYLVARKLPEPLMIDIAEGSAKLMYESNIQRWINREPKLEGATFGEVMEQLEKIALRLI